MLTKRQGLSHSRIIEGPTHDGAQVEGDSLEVDILGRVACLHVGIPETSFAILSGNPHINRA